jgi:hypothetical protein
LRRKTLYQLPPATLRALRAQRERRFLQSTFCGSATMAPGQEHRMRTSARTKRSTNRLWTAPMHRTLLTICALAAAAPALAAEPSGCDKFKWPIEHEQAVLTGAATKVDSGASIDPAEKAITLALGPQADAKLPSPPERLPKEPDTIANRSAGYVRVGIPTAGTYTVALSAAAWLDAIQDGKSLKPSAFSGATDCAGIRKVVKFDLAAGSLLLQVSSVVGNEVVLMIAPSK